MYFPKNINILQNLLEDRALWFMLLSQKLHVFGNSPSILVFSYGSINGP